MTLITFTSPDDDIVQTAVSWEFARTLSNMGRRIVYLSLVPEAQTERLKTISVEICSTPLEVRQALLRSNFAMVKGLDLGWTGTARLMQMVRAGRRAGAIVIIAGGLQHQSFIEICLASDLTVQCVNPTETGIESAGEQRQRLVTRANWFGLETGHVVSLFAGVETARPALSIAGPKVDGKWLHDDLGETKGLVDSVCAQLQLARQAASPRHYTDTLYSVAHEVMGRASGDGAHIRAMAGRSWFLHVGLLREEFDQLPRRSVAYTALAS